MRADWPGAQDTVLRVDGGMTASDYTMRFLADILGAPVERQATAETTALGAAYLAGLQVGLCPPPADMMGTWQAARRWTPEMQPVQRHMLLAAWRDAVRRTRGAIAP
jgi:glycerol kinase